MNTLAALAVAATATLATASVAHADTTDAENPLDTTTTTTAETRAETPVETHASTTHTPTTRIASMFSLGVSIGQTGQQTGGLILYFPEHRTTTIETQLHAGYHPDRVVEMGLDLELGAGTGLRSMAAIGEAKAYLLPMLPVSPTLTAGAGFINEYATSMSEQSTWRVALVAGTGLEGRIGRWSASLDLRLMAVRSDGQPSLLTTMDNEFTHDGIVAASLKAGVSRRF